MIKQASVRQIRQGERTRKDGYVVITMCFYPRGLKKALRDDGAGKVFWNVPAQHECVIDRADLRSGEIADGADGAGEQKAGEKNADQSAGAVAVGGVCHACTISI